MTRPRGFTLLELLLASVLLTTLMIGALAVVADLGSAGVTPGGEGDRKADSPRCAVEIWAELLDEDLRQAVAVCVSDANEVFLLGWGHLEGGCGERTGRPALVLYSLDEIGGHRWLARRQVALDHSQTQNGRLDLVCRGITRFELRPAGQAGQTSIDPKGPPSDRLAGTVRICDMDFPIAPLPNWARRDLPNGQWVRNDSALREPHSQSSVTVESTPRPVKAWSLRVWTDQSDAATLERLVGAG